jgi:hypothetical protein
MRKLIVAGVTLTALLGLMFLTMWQPAPLPVASPVPWPYGHDVFVEPECAAVARNRPPDMVWTAPNVPAGEFLPTPISDIRVRMIGQKVRLAGVLLGEPRFFGLFPTWAAAYREPRNAVRVGFAGVVDAEHPLLVRAAMVSGRCAVVEGLVDHVPAPADAGWSGPARVFPITRLAVWSQPFYDVTVEASVPPPPPASRARR